MAESAAADRALAKLRERYRGLFPHERLILCIDRRADASQDFHVLAIDRTSAWYDLLPSEQIAEIVDLGRERS